jgi:prepilin-type N-terminal cleavage/methylation domain-containing protein
MKYCNNKGFSFIELAIVIVLMGIILGIAYPKFERSMANWELNVTARKMATDIRRWQQKAVTEEKSGLKLTINQEQKIYYLKEDIYIKETHDLSDVVKSISVAPVTFNNINFTPTGKTSAAGTIALENRAGGFKYIIVNTTGRVRVSSTRP